MYHYPSLAHTANIFVDNPHNLQKFPRIGIINVLQSRSPS